MPSNYSYPGVYIEEVPSGVRTITGVSTSVAAFVGSARRGPINKAVRLLSYTDFERSFGGLSANSYAGYAVRQFFINGGSEAWMVRLAKDASAATRELQNADGDSVLRITALNEGSSGNSIEVRVDYQTTNPDSTFNLTFNYVSANVPSENYSESFRNLAMNSQDARYVLQVVCDGASRLVKVERIATQSVLSVLGSGSSLSGELDKGGSLIDVATLSDADHDQFQISVNGSMPLTIQITAADLTGANSTLRLTALCNAIAAKVAAASATEPLLSKFACVPDGKRIRMTSGIPGEASCVRVLPGLRRDLSVRLRLGAAGGGIEQDAAAVLRPSEIPDHGGLTSAELSDNDVKSIPSATCSAFKISIDGDAPAVVDLGTAAAAGTKLADRLADIAARIQAGIRGRNSAKPAYTGFTATVSADNKRLVLISGSRSAGSSVMVSAADSNDIAASLRLLGGATAIPSPSIYLLGGTESPYADGDAYPVFIADRSARKGIYALESVDLFNILCLPGVSDAGILQDADAYCGERRAILLVDAPQSVGKPADMVSLVTGSTLPKSKNAAVYYPWIKIADPLKNGSLSEVPPSGSVAGLFARTDSTRGVWKAPAGTEATLMGAQGTSYVLTDGENGILNPLGVNCIRSFPVFGTIAWGARTLRGADEMVDEWKYLSVRRTALFIEESLYRGTKWVVFEPNDEPLWAQIRLNLGAFMHGLFRQGAFQGKTPKEAYFVKCDSETTTQDDINRGIVNILVGFAPLKPAEFVVIKLQQMAGQIQA